jgi:hypothetical protein
MNINLHIERLILDGLPVERSQAPNVQSAVEAELTRLLVEGGLAGNLQAGGVVPGIPGDQIQFAPGINPSQAGTQIAKSVYNGIGNKE